MSHLSSPVVWWRVDGGGGVYFRKTKDLEDKVGEATITSAPSYSCWRAVKEEDGFIQCENGYWLPTKYMAKVKYSKDEVDRSKKHQWNRSRRKLMEDVPTIIPYMKTKVRGVRDSHYCDDIVFANYYQRCKDYEEELDIAIYVTGLPKTNKSIKLKHALLKRSLDIFGAVPLVCDLHMGTMDHNKGYTTGEAYLEFPDHIDLSEVVIKSDRFFFDKNHKIYTMKCRHRPCKSYDTDIINWHYDGLWYRPPTKEEMEEQDRQFKEYEKRFKQYQGEIPDPAWKECVVTPEITSEYWAKMQASMDEFGYKDGESCGTIPTTLNKDGIKYELIQYSSHGFTCDEPMCQAMFQASDENDGGMAAAFVYTRLPIYTCRETVGETHEFLVSDTETKKGYFDDLCYVCLTK